MAFPHLKESLCGCSLQTGTKIIGWANLIPSIIYISLYIRSAIIISNELFTKDDLPKEEDNYGPTDLLLRQAMAFFKAGAIAMTIALCSFHAIGAAFHAFLLVGAYKERATPVVCWIIEQITYLVYDVCLLAVVIIFSWNLKKEITILVLFDVIFCIYGLFIVNSYLYSLKHRGRCSSISYRADDKNSCEQ